MDPPQDLKIDFLEIRWIVSKSIILGLKLLLGFPTRQIRAQRIDGEIRPNDHIVPQLI